MIQAGSLPERMGFRTTKLGGHRARSMMSAELALLLEAVPPEAPAERYAEAVVDDNVLGKSTASNRRYSLECLRNLYALDPDVPLFRALRRLWLSESSNRPLLAFQCAYARETLVRATASVVLEKRLGATHERSEMEEAIRLRVGEEYSEIMVCSLAKNINSSWTQAGFLEGRARKRRSMPSPGVANVAYALFVAYADGYRGESALDSPWVKLLPLSREETLDLAEAASRNGMLRLMRSGGVVEFRFPGYLSPEEEELFRG